MARNIAGPPDDERRIPLSDTTTGKRVITGREGRRTIFARAY